MQQDPRAGPETGWLIVPDRLAGEQATAHGVTYAQPSVITQAGYANLLERGDVDRHLRRTRRVYRARRAALVQSLAGELPEIRVEGASSGLHVRPADAARNGAAAPRAGASSPSTP